MKKRFTFLTAAMLLLSLMVPSLAVWGGQIRTEEVVAYTLTPASGSNNSYAGNCDITISGITWNLTGNSTMQPWRIGGKNLTAVDRELYSKTAISDNITKIEVTHGTASSVTVNSWTVIVSKNSDFSNPVSTLTPTFAANTTTTINRPDDADWTGCYYKFVYNVTIGGDNKFIQFTEAKFYKEASGATTYTVTYNANDGSQNPTIYQITDATSPHTVLAIDDENINFTYDGHVFSHWHTTADGTSGNSYAAGDEMPLSDDVTLYAIWTSVHNITMPANTATDTYAASYTYNATTTNASTGVPYGATVTLTYTGVGAHAGWIAAWSVDNEAISGNTFTMPDKDVSVTATVTAAIVYEWVETDLADLTGSDIFVIVGNNGSNYAMSNDNGTGAAPDAISVTVTNGKITAGIVDKIKWNISGNADDGYTFYPNGSTTTWLYCTSTNNGVRVGTNASKTFKINKNYIQHQGTSRYMGVYDSQDWRCYSVAEPNNHGNIGGQTFAFYKRQQPAAVATPTLSVEAGTYDANQSVTITCATGGATIYYTTDGTTPTNLSTEYTEAVSITQTTTLKAIAIKGDDESEVASATYTLKCATPTFSPVAGTYTSVQNVEISCTSPEVSIYYTLDGTTPTSSSTLYNDAINVDETKTIKAIAIKSNWENSVVVSATYTINLPLTTMDAIFAKATAVGSTATSVNITFNNWVITGVNDSKHAFLSDGEKGCIIYVNNHGGFSEGDILSGTANCNVQLFNASAELTNITTATEGLTVTPGSSPTPRVTTIDALGAINSGSLVTLKDLTYNGSTLSDGVNSITPYNTIYSATLTNGKTYDVTGVFVLNNTTKRINPRREEDIVLKADLSGTSFIGLTTFTYIVDNGPSAAQYIGVVGTDFVSDLTITASRDYEISTSENGDYISSIVVKVDEGEIAETIYVRLKAGLAKGTHNGTLTFTATNLTTVERALEGTVSATQTYNVIINSPIANGTVTADASVAVAGTTITLTATPDDCYQFVGWETEPDDLTWKSANQFTMPAEDVLISATFEQKTFTVSYSFNGSIIYTTAAITCGGETTLLNEDDLETLEVVIPSGFYFQGWSEEEGSSTLVSSPYTPTATRTLYAVLTYGQAEAYYAKVTSDLGTNWAGDYLIAYSSTIFADGRVGGTSKDGIGYANQSIDISDYISGNNIPAINGDTYKVTLVEISSGSNTYVLKTQDNKYNYYTNNTSNGLSANSSITIADDYPLTVTFISEDDIRLCLGGAAEGSVFRYNSGSKGDAFFRFYKNCGQNPVHLYKRTVSEAPNFNEVVNVANTQTILTNITESTCVIVENDVVLTFNGENQGTAENLIIEDGGQLIIPNNATVAATFVKNMPEASKDANDVTVTGWKLISSPTNNGTTESQAYENFDDVNNLVDDAGYLLYKYDEENRIWRSSQTTGHTYNTLNVGQGYLYGNKTGIAIKFTGNVNSAASYSVALSYNTKATDNLAGFNLIGNPYAENISTTDITFVKNEVNVHPAGGYVLKNDGTWNTEAAKSFEPNSGFLVQINAAGYTAVIRKPVHGGKATLANNDYISFTVANSQYEDVTYAWFGKSIPLNKINHRNDEIPMLYIPQNGENYAIAMMDDNTNSFNLNFEAKTTGNYTLRFKANGEFNYLHVIDRLTGEDIDMLVEGEYSFVGSPRDNANRFIVRLGYLPNYSDNGEDIFAYQNGSDIVVCGEGELQIFDVMGRKVSSQRINGVETMCTSSLQNGVYVFRLNEKTQKIVVR